MTEKTLILGTKFVTRSPAGRRVFYGREGEREYYVGFAEKDSCGNPLGWYYTVYGPGIHRCGTDSRPTWFPTPEAALTAARVAR